MSVSIVTSTAFLPVLSGVSFVLVVAASYLLRCWGLIGADLREGMAEEEQNMGIAIFTVLVWFFAVPASALFTGLGVLVGSRAQRTTEPTN